MDRLTGSSLTVLSSLFETYTSNLPVIFSVIEGQYEGLAYVDPASSPAWALLRTPFCQHFLAGEPRIPEKTLEDLLFGEILSSQQEKEIVVFASNERWHPMLQSIFARRKGVCDERYIFRFVPERYASMARPAQPEHVSITTTKALMRAPSTRPLWSAEVWVDGQSVSACEAIMMGHGMAEIDISTKEEHRGKGYATLAAFALIDMLLKQGITPSWTTWPFRKASQAVARKVGFEYAQSVPAWIWLEQG